MSVRFADVTVGARLPEQTFSIERATLIRYAGASGDFNPIHWNQETAVAVGLPDVIAHGMLTMATAIRVVTDWLGDPGAVLDYKVRFSHPVVVAADAPTQLAVSAVVRSMDSSDQTAEIQLTASVPGQTVLTKARVRVRLEA
ncbi:MAG TPA: MaoC/PaaZ C-terminal domain-containing protein [Jatrophihabitans sp.]|jgi:acyl dehydratase|uniref:MaoC/PaaZ C-terminal domain-containing protein n=1 Tax=Jatrophihabitans sp. TaxID=1932789 RepID=UPI002F1DB91C